MMDKKVASFEKKEEELTAPAALRDVHKVTMPCGVGLPLSMPSSSTQSKVSAAGALW